MSSFLNRTVLMLAASTALAGPSTVAFAREAPVQLALMQAAGGSYTVQRGDTLTGISRKVGVSPEALSEANDLGSGARIDAGMKLKVPGGDRSAPARAQAAGRVVTVSSGPSTYVVRSGDTVDEIADRMGMSRKALADLNGLKSPYALSVGRKLKGPTETRKAYVVADGDSLEAVARRFSVTPKALAAENGLRTSAALRSGQKLSLPDGYRDRGPVRSASAPAPKAPAPVREARLETVREATEATPAAPEEAPRDKVSTRTLASGKVVSVKGKPAAYTVRKGDTVDEIADRMGLTRKELAALNGLKSPYALKPGQVLKGPAETQKAYVVTQGDTLSVVARRFGTTSKALAATNGLKATSSLRSGQRLILPDGVRDRGPIRETVRTPAPPVTRPAVAVRPPVTEPEAPLEAPLEDPATRAPSLRIEPGQGSPPSPAPIRTPAPVPVPVTPPPQVLPLPVPIPQVATPKPVLPLPAPPPAVRTTPPQSLTPAPVRPPPSRTPPPVVVPTPAPPAPRPQSGGFTPPPTSSTTPLTDAQIATLGKGRFVWPIRGEILSDFGPKGTGQRNDGVNVRAVRGAPVRASAAGEVVYAGDQVPGFGNLVLIKHPEGWVTAYAHMSNVDVKIQQKVLQGQQIGEAGDTGGVSEPQLHFEIRYAPTPAERARPVSPTLLLPR
jgi:murein DD-endopeptidase MepM/ murein hydrolase activator NlpD